jgi:hypothetical protein
MLRAYGELAQRRARLLSPDFPAILCDVTHLKEAYLEAISRRERGEAFFLQTCLLNKDWQIASLVSRTLCEKSYGPGEWRTFAEQLAEGALLINGNPASRLSVLTASDAQIIRDLHLLADCSLVGSDTELAELAAVLGNTPRWSCRLPMRENLAAVPAPQRSSLVLWAPEATWDELAFFTVALREFRYPVAIVASTVPAEQGPFRWYTAESSQAALATAAAIVDATIDRPGAALGLAALGVPLAVCSTNGAHEFLAGSVVFAPWNWRSIQHAAATVLGSQAPTLQPLPSADDALALLERTRPTVSSEPPLVSVVIPTYNRPSDLDRALDCIGRQFYPNIECIVVNDAGVAVDDIVNAHSFARLITLEHNVGGLAALNIGARETTGKYFCLLPDDDVFYPDHIARMVQALEQTGAAVAHGNGLIRYLEESDDGFKLHGFNASTFAHHADPVHVFSSSPVQFHAEVIRRDLLERLGWFDESFKAVADLEVQMRLAAHSAFVHVENVTVEWVVRNANSYNTGKKYHSQAGEQLSILYERYPMSDYPSLIPSREAAVRQSHSLPADGWFFPPVIRF